MGCSVFSRLMTLRSMCLSPDPASPDYRLAQCLKEIVARMRANWLKLSPNRTEVMLIGRVPCRTKTLVCSCQRKGLNCLLIHLKIRSPVSALILNAVFISFG